MRLRNVVIVGGTVIASTFGIMGGAAFAVDDIIDNSRIFTQEYDSNTNTIEMICPNSLECGSIIATDGDGILILEDGIEFITDLDDVNYKDPTLQESYSQIITFDAGTYIETNGENGDDGIQVESWTWVEGSGDIVTVDNGIVGDHHNFITFGGTIESQTEGIKFGDRNTIYLLSSGQINAVENGMQFDDFNDVIVSGSIFSEGNGLLFGNDNVVYVDGTITGLDNVVKFLYDNTVHLLAGSRLAGADDGVDFEDGNTIYSDGEIAVEDDAIDGEDFNKIYSGGNILAGDNGITVGNENEIYVSGDIIAGRRGVSTQSGNIIVILEDTTVIGGSYGLEADDDNKITIEEGATVIGGGITNDAPSVVYTDNDGLAEFFLTPSDPLQNGDIDPDSSQGKPFEHGDGVHLGDGEYIGPEERTLADLQDIDNWTQSLEIRGAVIGNGFDPDAVFDNGGDGVFARDGNLIIVHDTGTVEGADEGIQVRHDNVVVIDNTVVGHDKGMFMGDWVTWKQNELDLEEEPGVVEELWTTDEIVGKDNTLIITSDGSLHGDNRGLRTLGTGHTILNSGSITAGNDVAIMIEGDAFIDNNGYIGWRTTDDPDAEAPTTWVAAITNDYGVLELDLETGTVVDGDILAGEGNDTVWVETGAIHNGDLDMGADADDGDIDTLVLYGEGSGTIAPEIIEVERLDKMGSGTWNTTGEITIDGETLTKLGPLPDDPETEDIDESLSGLEDDPDTLDVDESLAYGQVFDRVEAVNVIAGRLNIGGLVSTDDDDDPDTADVLTPDSAAILNAPHINVHTGAELGGHGTIVTSGETVDIWGYVQGTPDAPIDVPEGFLREEFVGMGCETCGFALLTDAPQRGTLAPGLDEEGQYFGTLTVDGDVTFDKYITETTTYVINSGEVDSDGAVIEAEVEGREVVISWGGEYEADIAADGRNDELLVTGSVELGGELEVWIDPDDHDYTGKSVVHDIIVADGGVIDEFQSINFANGENDGAVVIDGDRVQVFKGYLDYQTDRVRIISIRDLAPHAGVQDELAIASDGALDYGLGTSSAHEAIAYIGALGDAEIANLFTRMSGEFYNAYNEVGISTAHGLIDQADERARQTRNGTRSSVSTYGTNSSAGSSGDARGSVWVSGNWNNSSVDSKKGYMEYDFDSLNAYLGFDYLVSDNFLLGIMGGFGNADVDFDLSNTSKGDVDTWSIGGYASYQADNGVQANLSGGYTGLDMDSTRDATFTSLGQQMGGVATSEHDGSVTYLHADLGYALETANGLVITPEIALTYAKVKQDALEETGAANYSLGLDKQSHESFQGSIAVQLSKTFGGSGSTTYTPHATVGVSHEFEDDVRVINGRLINATVVTGDFNSYGEVAHGTMLTVGAGVDIDLNDTWSVRLDYAGEFGGRLERHAAFANVRAAF